MIKAYIFDWEKTLGNFSGSSKIREYLDDEQHNLLLVKRLEEVDLDKKSVYQILMNVNLTIYPDSFDIISYLKSKYKLAIISNMYHITAQRVRKSFNEFLSNFDVITLSAEVGLKKPDHEIFIYTFNRLNSIYKSNIKFEETIMIGDNLENDIIPALKLGMQAKIIDRKNQTLKDLI